MTWTVTQEKPDKATSQYQGWTPRIHVRAIIDLDNEQDELNKLIVSLQKHVKSDAA